jgi:hypothetical protein
MGLLDLPPEILDLIIDRTLRCGFENFVLSCKAVYMRARPQMDRHNMLKSRWRHTSNASPTRRGDTLSIIHEITCEPLSAQYVESLSLWDRRSKADMTNSPEVHSFRDDENAMNSIKTFLRSAKYFTGGEVDFDSWWEQIIAEDEAGDDEHMDKLYATVALLSLLPNLKTLQLPDRWHEVRETEAAEALVPSVQSLVTLSNSVGYHTTPLGTLETIFPFVEEGYDVRVGLQCLQPFMELQSIRNLYAVSCVAVDEDWGGIPFHWPNPTTHSPLTKLELASCCMNGSGLASLLPHTPGLTVFKYSHQTKWDGLENDWNPGEILEALANFASQRLVELALTVDELHGEIENGLSSFMRLPKLQKLEVDVQAFCGPPLESGQRLGRNARVPAGQPPWTHNDIPCMGDMLPESMCELHVNTDFPEPSKEALKALFKNIVDRRKDKLMNLHTTIVRQYRSSSAKKLAVDHAITLESFDEHVANPRPRSMMPLWKRQFDSIVGGIVFADG